MAKRKATSVKSIKKAVKQLVKEELAKELSNAARNIELKALKRIKTTPPNGITIGL